MDKVQIGLVKDREERENQSSLDGKVRVDRVTAVDANR